MITGTQVRGARGLLGMSQEELADKSKVSISTVKSFEHIDPEKRKTPRVANMEKIRNFLESKGANFTWRTDDGGQVWEGVEVKAE